VSGATGHGSTILDTSSPQAWYEPARATPYTSQGTSIAGLDTFEADSASLLKQLLADFGIDLYCPVSTIGDAVPGPTFRG
jgi:hypothetical protein